MDPGIYDLGLPILGICYGHQLARDLRGRVSRGEVKEYGHSSLHRAWTARYSGSSGP